MTAPSLLPGRTLAASANGHPALRPDPCRDGRGQLPTAVVAVGARVAGLDPAQLVRAHGSPLFVYDLDVVSARVAALRAALPASAEIAYAVKANPCAPLLAHLASLGPGADVASGGELDAVIRAGWEPRRVVFTGPGKTDAEIARALRSGVRALTIESLDELDVVLDLAAVAGPHQGLLLRLAVDGAEAGPGGGPVQGPAPGSRSVPGPEAVPIIGGPGASKFGLLPDEVDEAVDRLLLAGAVGGAGAPFELLGLHAFGASNVRDAGRLVEGVRILAVRAERLAERHGLRTRLLDAGGGLGIPYADDEEPLDLGSLADGLADEIATWPGRAGLAGTRLLLEPGRFIVGPAGAYLVRVVRTKTRGGRTVAITDGGIHHLLRPALIGQAQRTVAVGDTAERPADGISDVVGPLCTGLDVLATGVPLPTPCAGDLLAVRDAGAYGFSESMPLFLSHPVPAEVCVSGGRVVAARPRVAPSAAPTAVLGGPSA